MGRFYFTGLSIPLILQNESNFLKPAIVFFGCNGMLV